MDGRRCMASESPDLDQGFQDTAGAMDLHPMGLLAAAGPLDLQAARPPLGLQDLPASAEPLDSQPPGRRWASGAHRVHAGGRVLDVRAVQRRPATERWQSAELAAIRAVLDPVAVTNESLGTVHFYRLYDERPERAEAPSSSTGATDLSMEGRVIGCGGFTGDLSVVVDDRVRCPVTPEDCSFDCGIIRSWDQVIFEVDGSDVPVEVSGYYTDLQVVVQ